MAPENGPMGVRGSRRSLGTGTARAVVRNAGNVGRRSGGSGRSPTGFDRLRRGFAQKPSAFDENKGLTATIRVTNNDLRQSPGVFVQSPCMGTNVYYARAQTRDNSGFRNTLSRGRGVGVDLARVALVDARAVRAAEIVGRHRRPPTFRRRSSRPAAGVNTNRRPTRLLVSNPSSSRCSRSARAAKIPTP